MNKVTGIFNENKKMSEQKLSDGQKTAMISIAGAALAGATFLLPLGSIASVMCLAASTLCTSCGLQRAFKCDENENLKTTNDMTKENGSNMEA